MFKTLLVPLDGSAQAEDALVVARRIARNTGATLVLVRVVSFLSEYWPAMTSTHPSLVQAVVDADLAQATTYLEKIAASAEMADLSVKITAQFGSPAPTILEVAASYNSDLIVLASRSQAGVTHWMMGNVVERVARYAAIPVLIVREGSIHLDDSSSDLAQPLRLLIPLDGSIGATTALEPGAELLLALASSGQKTALHLARVCKQCLGNDVASEQPLPEVTERAQARGALQQTVSQIQQGNLAPFIAEHSLPVTWSLLVDRDIVGGLLRVAEQGDDTEGAGTPGGCDLIAISTHGRSDFRDWIPGSITERVLHATRRPILIIHPLGAKEQSLAGGKQSLLAFTPYS